MDKSHAIRRTDKLYYTNQYLRSASAVVIRIYPNAIELDRTVAYPEGGGQEADTGVIQTAMGILRFVGAKKIYGAPIELEGFKGGTVGGIILHLIHPDDYLALKRVNEGAPVKVAIDIERRQRLSIAHSASHFIYAAAIKHREELEQCTLGCHIKETSARFDFLVDQPFQAEDIRAVEKTANNLIALNLKIEHLPVSDLQDALIWKYQGIEIPCGGTHLDSPADIGFISVRRKRLGKGKERLSCSFEGCKVDLGNYHEEIL